MQVRIVDPERGEVLPAGDTGEIEVLSPSRMAGYLPESETAAAFRDGWYRTGDIGWLEPEGWLHITDRLKEMVKVRGFQVAPAEIEAVLHGDRTGARLRGVRRARPRARRGDRRRSRGGRRRARHRGGTAGHGGARASPATSASATSCSSTRSPACRRARPCAARSRSSGSRADQGCVARPRSTRSGDATWRDGSRAREAEDPGRDDVLLDLGGATHDALGAAVEIHLQPGVVGVEHRTRCRRPRPRRVPTPVRSRSSAACRSNRRTRGSRRRGAPRADGVTCSRSISDSTNGAPSVAT